VSVERNGIAADFARVEREEDAFHSCRRLLGAQQHTSAAAVRALEVGAKLDILKRFVEHQPAPVGRLGFAHQLAVHRFPVGGADDVPAGERAALEGPVGDEHASRAGNRHSQERGECRRQAKKSTRHHVSLQEKCDDNNRLSMR